MIFDASSIFAAIRNSKPEVLKGNVTCRLAKYELGNALWKEVYLHKSLKFEEAKEIMEIILRAMRVMRIEEPSWTDAFRISADLNITFYDASYVQLAVANSDILVTEDKKLRRKTKGVVKTLTVLEV